MKILHTVEFYHPSIGGSQEVVRQLSERMAAAGHEVVVATSSLPQRTSDTHNGVRIQSFDISGNAVRGYQGDTQAYQDFVQKSDFDVVMNYAAQEWAADLVFPILSSLRARKIFVPCGYSGLPDPAYKGYFKSMPAILRQYDATIYLSNNYRDIDFARKHKVKNLHIIPNGADEKEFLHEYPGDIRRELRLKPGTSFILHVGSFTGVKGHDEAIDIFAQTNLTNATLVLVGNPMDKSVVRHIKKRVWAFNTKLTNIKLRRKIAVRHIDRARTVASLQAADVFLFPSNIEASPLVLFEACAARTPFLTSEVGNAQEIVEWTQGGLVLPTRKDAEGYSHALPQESAKILEGLVGDEKRRKRLARAGYAAWNKHYRWDKLAEQYLKLYKEPSR